MSNTITSTLKLVQDCPIIEERNFKVDNFSDITSNTAGLGYVLTISNFQYVKHSLNLSIKVNLEQSNLEYIQNNNYNYMTITHSSTGAKEVGYFIVGKKWLSENTIQFDLRMDTINTFLDSVQLSDKTKILREHKDRFKYVPSGSTKQVINREPMDFNMATDWDVSEGAINQSIYEEATSGIHEKTFIARIEDFNGLPFEYSYDGEIFWKYYCPEHEVQDFELYTLDANYKVVRRIEVVNGEESYWLAYDGTFKDFNGNYITLTASEKYFALRVRYTFFAYDIEHEQDVNYIIQLFLDSGWYDEPTQEEINDLYSAYNSIRTTFLQSGTFSGGDKLLPIIDRYPENINPVLYGKTIRTLQEKYYLNQSWYLAFMNQNTPDSSLTNPVDCFVIPERKVYVKPSATASSLTWNGSQLSDAVFPVLNVPSWADWNEDYMQRRYVIIHPKNNNGCRIQITPAVVDTDHPAVDITMNGADVDLVMLTPFNGFVGVFIFGYGYNPFMYYYDSTASITITNGQKAVQGDGLEASTFEEIASWPVFPLFANSGTSETLNTIDDIDRTDPKLIKIIKLPYCPMNCYQDEHNYIIYDVNQWQTATIQTNKKVVKFKNVAGNVLQRLIEFDGENPFDILVNDLGFVPSRGLLKSADYETKLYHSEFYQPKVIYDSFSFAFQLELMDAVNELSSFRVNFNVATGIVSRFMFTFVDYVCSDTEVMDYNNIMYVSRNNEITIYNQQWLNYLRTGYNFDRASTDIKNNQLAVATGYQGTLSVFDRGTSGFAQGGVAGAIMGTGRGIMDFGFRIYNTINEVKMSEMALQRTATAKQYATTGVIDANDVDLMTAYAKNLLTYKVYKVSPRMKKVLFDLFFYTGYIANYLGIPNTTSRTYFNYVSAELVFKKVPNLPIEIIEDIKARYLAGITFMHKVGVGYDFDQKYENWETSLFDE